MDNKIYNAIKQREYNDTLKGVFNEFREWFEDDIIKSLLSGYEELSRFNFSILGNSLYYKGISQ